MLSSLHKTHTILTLQCSVGWKGDGHAAQGPENARRILQAAEPGSANPQQLLLSKPQLISEYLESKGQPAAPDSVPPQKLLLSKPELISQYLAAKNGM
jgi:hypothetical protein